MDEKNKKPRFSPHFNNWITYAGVLLAITVFLAECFLFVIDFFVHSGNLYLGMVTYIILPPFLILGLLLIPAGAWWKQRQIRLGKATLGSDAFKIDLSLPHHRNAFVVFFAGTMILVMMTFVGAYKGFQYTESVEFCGLLCHHIMKPEHTAYLHSPHGRVKCVECHIGSGADWYVRSKMSGLRQVVRAIDGTYKRPIETPVKNLRPAEETCAECHWPEKLFSTFDFKRTYFLTEGDERRWDLRMLMNVGGGEHGAYGVHAHMNVDHDIYYAAEDEKRQKITWVKSVSKNGEEMVYTTPNSKFKTTPPPDNEIRKMDCIDCHNRPTHHFYPPYRLVNEGLMKGKIDADLPNIKDQSMKVLSDSYKTEKEAMDSIPRKLMEYYQKKYPETASSQKEAIARSAEYLKEVFSKNIFPEMKARWDVFPDNIGHLVTPGCFRCHDNQHAAPGGKVISQDCKACHLIVEQGPHGAVQKNIEGLDFVHPVDDENGWKDMSCSDCHTGANP